MAKISGGHLVAKALKAEGVEATFGLIGGHMQDIWDGCLDAEIKVIDVRHEQASAHAAEGWSRITHKLGTCVVTAGPGITDAFTGVANAYQGGSPMLCIGGMTSIGGFEVGSFQEMDHTEFMKPVTKWARTCYETQRLPEYVAIAAREAFAGKPGPVFLQIPVDVLNRKVDEETVKWPSKYRTEARPMGDSAYVRQAAELIVKAETPAVIAGNSVHWSQAWGELQEFTRSARLPVFLNGLGRGTVPPDHPYYFAHSRRFALSQADVVVVIGTPLDFRLAYGQSPLFRKDAKIIQIDTDAKDIGVNRPIDVGIVGDSKMILLQLIDELKEWAKSREETAWVQKIRDEEGRAESARESQLNSDQVPVHPLRLCKEMRDFITKDTIVVGDGGEIVRNAASVLQIHRPGHWMDPGRFGALGVGTGFAMAAKAARPDQPVFMVLGDGTFGLNGMEFCTFVRHKLPIIGVVGNDGQWGQAIVGVERAYGRDRVVGCTLGHIRYDKIVEDLGGYGEYVERPEDIRPALERAAASGLPALVNVKTDPSIIRLPFAGVHA